MRPARGVLALGLIAACGGDPSGAAAPAGGAGAGGGAGSAGACATSDTDAIRLGLAPACEACHGPGASRPFFASLAAFESLLVYNPAYVVRGAPDKSKLVALLEGKAAGSFPQMPPGAEPYARLAPDRRPVSMERISSWIRDLPPPSGGAAGPSAGAVMTRRLRVGELRAALQATLGYEPKEAKDGGHTGGPPRLWLRDPDQLGEPSGNNELARNTWKALGGGSSLARVPAEATWSAGSLQVYMGVSLEWCGEAVKRGDDVVFRHATPADTLPSGRDKIRKNIGYLHLRLLGEPATDADLDAYLDDLFARAEPRGAEVAWTEVCAALVRDPRFLSF